MPDFVVGNVNKRVNAAVAGDAQSLFALLFEPLLPFFFRSILGKNRFIPVEPKRLRLAGFIMCM